MINPLSAMDNHTKFHGNQWQNGGLTKRHAVSMVFF